MKKAFECFEKIINDIDNVSVLYNYCLTNSIPLDVSDLLRWQWVQLVSALDKLIHDLVLSGMMEQYWGIRPRTNKFNKFSLNIEIVLGFIDSDSKENLALLLNNQIIKSNSIKSFQDPDKISEALSYIWDENNRWQIISNDMQLEKEQCKTFLKNIVLRRNQIAHEGDYTADYSRQEVYYEDILEIKAFIFKLGQTIYDIVKIETV